MQKKAPRFELIEEDSNPYAVLTEARDRWHGDLESARIALAWQSKLRADMDGHLILGKCVKVTELYKEFADYDYIILLNKDVWQSPEFTQDKKLALLDHELCHAAPAYDEQTGEQKYDSADRLVWRVRKHDIEEFRSVVEHHGCYKRDLEKFAETIMQRAAAPLLDHEEITDNTPEQRVI